MNFLQLVQRLRRKCRVAGSGPTTVVGAQAEENARLIDWTNEAWNDIQTIRPDWQWMRTTCSFTTTTLQSSYTPTQVGLTDFGNWKVDSFRNYVTAAGLASEILMDDLAYDDWRNTYLFGATRFTATRPTQVAIAPDFSVCLGPVPAAGYTVTGEYYRVPSEMAANADTPAIPLQYHMIIIYRAMMYYGASEGASEVYQEGELEYKKMLNRLAMQQLVDISLGGALA